MSMSLVFGLDPSLGLEVSPGLVAFGEMLMLPAEALEQAVADELDANDALERLEPDACPVCSDGWRGPCPACSRGPARVTCAAGEQVAGVIEDADRVTDSQMLLRDVLLETPGVDRAVAEYVIGSLDRHGFLDRPVEALAAELGTGAGAVVDVVEAVRRVGPAGVGASDVRGCLLLQLQALGLEGGCARLAQAVVADHLPALGRGNFARIAADLGVTVDEVRAALDLIRDRLRPYPAFDGNDTGGTCFAVPDVVVVERHDVPGTYGVELVEPAFVRLRVRRDAGLPSGASADARAFVARLHGRWETLRLVAGHVVERQSAHVADARCPLRPLTRAEVAAALGVHESTVSRTVANKYALLPDRTLRPLAAFFGTSGGLDDELRRLVVAAGDRPVSDQQLADQLGRAGYPVARRTVAKHRARLGIPSLALR